MRPASALPGRRLLSAALLALAAGCGGHVLPEIHSDAERLSVARRLHAERDYADAIELLKTYISSSSGARDVDEAIYLLGDSYLRIKDWALAAAEFERLLRDYPESDSAGSASFRLGEAFFGQARRPDFDQDYTWKALEQWQTYRRSYPGHWLHPEADRRILEARTRLARKLLASAELYLKLKLAEPALIYYQRILDEYPETSVVPEATLGIALAEIRLGRRDQALQRLRDIETRYAGQEVAGKAARERSRLERRS